MTQEKEFKSLLTLLRAGLWERAVDDVSLFPISGEEWGRIYTLSCQQSISGIVYRGISHLPTNMIPSEVEMIKWMSRVDAVERSNNRINNTLNKLHSLFGKQGLHSVLQKGYLAAQMYEKPLLREAGDIDLWFTPEEWDRAYELVKNSIGGVEKMPDGSCVYVFDGVEVEHHKKMFDIDNPFKKSYLSTIFGMNNGELCAGDVRVGLNKLSPLANVVLQNSHILKHSLGLGIGLRQLCDLARTYYRLSATLDGERVKSVYEKLGLRRWSRMLHTYLVTYIGLDPHYLPYEIDREVATAQFANIIMRGGNFGMHNKRRISAANSFWRRKINTFVTFMQSLGFAIKYAPFEFVCRVSDLTVGQLRR